MASIIKLKRSLTPGSTPGSLEAGELAINLPDRKLFSSNGSVVFPVSGDQYNLTTTTGADPTITLTVDNDSLSNDSIQFAGGTGVTVSESGGTITITATGTAAAGDNTVATSALQDGAVTAAKIASEGLGANTLASNAVTTAKVADGAITAAKIANLGLGANTLASSAVTNAKLASNAVTTAKIADAQITSPKLAAGAVTANAIANDSVALGTKTTGNYVAGITGGTDINVSGSGSENATVTVNLDSTISANTTGNAATATALATARTIGGVSFDGTANIDLPGVNTTGNQDTSGNAATATALETARTIIIAGDVAGSASFDGTANATITVTQQNNSVDLGTHTTGNYVATITGTANEIEVTGSGSETAAVTIGLPDNVTIGNNLTVSGNTAITGDLTVDGNLEVNGTLTYIDSTTVTIGDNMLKLANTNVADTVDLGFYATFNDGSTKYTGLVRDATDGTYTLFTDLATEPDQQINFGNATVATLNAVIDGGTF